MSRRLLITLTVVATTALVTVAVVFVRSIVMHGAEDKTEARVVALAQICAQSQPEAADSSHVEAALRSLGFTDPRERAAYLLHDGLPVLVAVERTAAQRHYWVAAFARQADVPTGALSAIAPSSLAHAPYLMRDQQWLRYQRHGMGVLTPEGQALLAP